MFSFINNSLSACIQRFYNYRIGKGDIAGVQKVYGTTCIIQVLLSCVVVILGETVGVWFIENKLVIPIGRVYEAKVLFHTSLISLVLVFLQKKKHILS